MKKRWMKSAIEASKSPQPVMPFQRAQKMQRKSTYSAGLLRKIKTA